jgi:serine phosphatase RsbU (regulator of sigma subunit)
LVLTLLFPAFLSKAQDTIYLEKGFTEISLPLSKVQAIVDPKEDPELLFPDSATGSPSLSGADSSDQHGVVYIKLLLKNNTNEIIVTSISVNTSENIEIFNADLQGNLLRTEKLVIRGLHLYGRIELQSNSTQTVYLKMYPSRGRSSSLDDTSLRIINYNHFLQRELPNRFVDALLIGLLLFSAFLNLILGIRLKRSGFFSLFLYLISLVLFSISFLGFYDEFMNTRDLQFPIGLPVYFLTLIFFLLVSKKYLQLPKHLPGWNTITNVVMFFLIVSIPYYYLTVFVEDLYNNFLAFSSLFFFVGAALLGLIESILLLKKVPKSRFFLVANLLVVVSLAINFFLENKYPIVIGSVIQGFIFTFGLAEEIKILDMQKVRFQQRYINQLEVNLRLKDQATAELEQKVEERTRELKKTNEDLKDKNYIVEQQKELLEIRNKEIKDSIEYARRIQTASFPPRNLLEKVSSDFFILYRPRDIVSGDFYWFGEVDEKVIVITADCTGHGVPGAFMSMYGIAFLNEIINKEKIFMPNEIMNSLREKISSSLNRGDNEFETMDGMDMSVITFDLSASRYYFSGANNPLYLIRQGELQVVSADNMPVAYYQKMEPFKVSYFEAKKGDCLYIFSDGLIDQFGGELGKKYLSKRLKDVLLSISHLNMAEQHHHIDEAFSEWKGEYFQVDDVLMVGIRI